MGKIETEITLVNAKDEANAEGGYISMNDVRKETVTAIVDTGSMRLVITEELYQKLGLTQIDDINANLADGRKLSCKVSSDVVIYCNKRRTVVNAVVIPGAEKILLGVIPLEDMDFMIDPNNQTLVGAHGDKITCMVY